MKNSSDNSRRVKGPIRTGAVVPSLILLALVGIYFSFFFDGNLRRGLEYAATQINGAEVDIGALHTSFIHAALEIRDIEVTDKEHPERNIAQLGTIKFSALWDALLRAKVVVDEASILDIQILTPRRHPGLVVPPAPPRATKSSLLADTQQAVVAQTRKDYNGGFLGDVAALVGGGDPKDRLKDLQTDLKSDAKIKELQKDLAEKKIKWEQRLKALPQAQELQTYADRIKVLKFDLKNPAELAKSVQQAGKIINEAKDKVKLVDQTQKDLQSDVKSYSLQYKDLEKMAQEDVQDLQTRLKLPKVDAKEFSQQLFMTMIEKKLGGFVKYVELARAYMPAKKMAEQKNAEPIIPSRHGSGKTYRFPLTTGYPLFWLKHAAISSDSGKGEFSGDVKGEIKDLTSDPAFLGKPARLWLQGDFPKQGVHGLDVKITMDHTTEEPQETMQMKIARFPLAPQSLSESPDVRLSLNQAQASSEVNATFAGQELRMEMKNIFTEFKYDLEARNKLVHDIIDGVLKGIPTVNVDADIKGSLHNLDIDIQSNLGNELSKGFQQQVQAKIDQAKAELKKMVDEKIGGDRTQLKTQMDQMTGALTKNMNGKKDETDKAAKNTQNQVNSQKDGQQKQLEEQGKELLKKFHLGG